MDETKVICECGHSAEDHSYDDGCEWSEYKVIYKYCECRKTKEALIIEYLEKQVSSLETDLTHARRVADERQEIIKKQDFKIESLRSFLAVYANEENWKSENGEVLATVFLNPSRNFDCAEEERAFEIAKRGLQING